MNDGINDFALGTIVFYQVIFLFYFLCFLKFHFGSKRLHLFHQQVTYNLGISFQNIFDFTDILHVFLVWLLPDAGPFAVLYVIFQTYVELAGANVFGT